MKIKNKTNSLVEQFLFSYYSEKNVFNKSA